MEKQLQIHPVYLTGGAGTRLWPLSTGDNPKQFVDYFGGISLFQRSVLRHNSSENLSFQSPITVTNHKFSYTVASQLKQILDEIGQIIIEPVGKNTAAAILAACFAIQYKDEDAIVLVSPSDHLIDDIEIYHDAIRRGLKSANCGKIVTFGIRPTHPETGFGYLELGAEQSDGNLELLQYIEKPNLKRAEQLISSGNFLWNSGIFLFKLQTMIDAFYALMPELTKHVQASFKKAKTEEKFFRLSDYEWNKAEDISIDYAIMEKLSNLTAVPLDCKWTDLGDWDSVWRETKSGSEGIATSKNVSAFDCKDVLLSTEENGQHLVGLGLENIIAVATKDAVLVAHKNKSQEVKRVVSNLKEKGIDIATDFGLKHENWGTREKLLKNNNYQVEQYSINPKMTLSICAQGEAAKVLIVTSGSAIITASQTEENLSTGQLRVFVNSDAFVISNNCKDILEVLIIDLT